MKFILKSLLALCFLSQVHCTSFNQRMGGSAELKYSDRVCNSTFDRVHLNTITTSSERPQYQECLQKSRRMHKNAKSRALDQIILAIWASIFGFKKAADH